MNKPIKMWACTYWGGKGICPQTIRRTKKEAINAFCYNGPNGPPDNWGDWQRRGVRAIKVLVQEQKP